MNRIGVYAGSFDPVTEGHLYVVGEALALFDRVFVAVGNNVTKKEPLFTPLERCNLIVNALREQGHGDEIEDGTIVVDVMKPAQLLVDYTFQVGATHAIRGIRSTKDFEDEQGLQSVNFGYAPEFRMVYIIPPDDLVHVSSSLVKGVLSYENGLEIAERYVPRVVLKALKEKVRS